MLSPPVWVALVLGADILGLLSGSSRFPVLSIAFVLCFAQTFWTSTRFDEAGGAGNRRRSGELMVRRMVLAAPVRLAVVTGVSCLLYRWFPERLGVGFWIAVIVFYQLSLLVHVAECRSVLGSKENAQADVPVER